MRRPHEREIPFIHGMSFREREAGLTGLVKVATYPAQENAERQRLHQARTTTPATFGSRTQRSECRADCYRS